MIKQALGRLVVRLYPQEARSAAGSELVGTLLDAGEVSLGAYLFQLASLVRAGLWSRARLELSRPIGQIVGSALSWLAVIDAMSVFVSVIGVRLYWGDTPGSDPFTIIRCYVLPVLIMGGFTLRRYRITGLLGLAWVAIHLYQSQQISTTAFIQTVPLQTAGFVLMMLKPSKVLPAGRFLWPAPAAVWLVYQVTLLGQLSGIGKITPVVAVLALLPWAPALALGTALDWGLTAIFYLNSYEATANATHLLVEACEFALGIPLAIILVWITRRATART
jgi:hypothetical protein